MFAGNAITGDSAFAPRANRQLNFISSDDEDEQAPYEFCTPRSHATPQPSAFTPSSGTPASSGSKRSANSIRSTATSLNKSGVLPVIGKKPKNVAVRNMNMGKMRWQDLYEQRTQKMGVRGEEKELTLEPELWRGVCNIPNTTKLFLLSPPAQQLQMIKDFAVIPVVK
jgi:hypothetical protein